MVLRLPLARCRTLLIPLSLPPPLEGCWSTVYSDDPRIGSASWSPSDDELLYRTRLSRWWRVGCWCVRWFDRYCALPTGGPWRTPQTEFISHRMLMSNQNTLTQEVKAVLSPVLVVHLVTLETEYQQPVPKTRDSLIINISSNSFAFILNSISLLRTI